jgi:hypothetical protein
MTPICITAPPALNFQARHYLSSSLFRGFSDRSTIVRPSKMLRKSDSKAPIPHHMELTGRLI